MTRSLASNGKGSSKPKQNSEENANNSQEMLRGILDAASNIAIMMVSTDGVILTWNKGAESVFNYRADEVIGQNFKMFYPREVLSQGQVEFEFREADTKGFVTAEGWRLAKGGRQFYAAASFSRLLAADGTVAGYVKIVRDETERVQKEENLRIAEEFTRSVINAASDIAIMTVSATGSVQTWSAGAQKIFGYTNSEIIGQDFRQFYPKEVLDQGQVDMEFREASGKGAVSAEGWRLAKGGRRFYAKASFSSIKDGNGTVTGFVKVVRDETESKLKEEELNKTEELNRGVLNASPTIAIYALSLEGNIRTWNKGSENVFGYRSDEAIGKDFRMFYPQEALEQGQVDLEFREANAKGTVSAEGWRLAKGGRRFYAKASFSSLLDTAGKVAGYVKIVQDETAQKAAQDKILSQQAVLEQQHEAIKDLVGKLSKLIPKLASTSSELSAAAAQSVASITETTAAAEEVKQIADQSSQKAKSVSESAKDAVASAKKGQESTNVTIQGMVRIKEQMESIGECMVQLSNQSKLIGDIIATVDDLAQQSNLLAVNASIEAAKAGEQGKGFAVVAQEVKNLSQQSKAATAHVRSILNDIVKATSAATMATEQGSKSVDAGHQQASEAGRVIKGLSEIIESASQSTSLIEISSQQQLVGMRQMVEAMESIKCASEQNLQGATDTTAVANDLNEIGKQLLALIEKK